MYGGVPNLLRAPQVCFIHRFHPFTSRSYCPLYHVIPFYSLKQLSQTEMEDAVAGTMDVFRKSLRTALDRAGATPGEVSVPPV